MTAPLPITILGIDPGVSGALAFYCHDAPHLVTAEDMPVVDGHVDASALTFRIEQLRPDFAMVELVSSMPKQGVASTFKFGRAFGTLLGVLAATRTPYRFAAPGYWKKHFRLPAEKEAARAMALRLWPERASSFSLKKHHGRAEAALIARFAAETIASDYRRVA